jgi:hypothetical protein
MKPRSFVFVQHHKKYGFVVDLLEAALQAEAPTS